MARAARRSSSRALLAAALGLLLAGSSCADRCVPAARLTSAGGSFSASDGGLVLEFPRGAVASPVELRLEPLRSDELPPAVLGLPAQRGWRLSPGGLRFDAPVRARVSLGELPGYRDTGAVGLTYLYTLGDDGRAEPLADQELVIDESTATGEISGLLEHFSRMVVFHPEQSEQGDHLVFDFNIDQRALVGTDLESSVGIFKLASSPIAVPSLVIAGNAIGDFLSPPGRVANPPAVVANQAYGRRVRVPFTCDATGLGFVSLAASFPLGTREPAGEAATVLPGLSVRKTAEVSCRKEFDPLAPPGDWVSLAVHEKLIYEQVGNPPFPVRIELAGSSQRLHAYGMSLDTTIVRGPIVADATAGQGRIEGTGLDLELNEMLATARAAGNPHARGGHWEMEGVRDPNVIRFVADLSIPFECVGPGWERLVFRAESQELLVNPSAQETATVCCFERGVEFAPGGPDDPCRNLPQEGEGEGEEEDG